MKRFAILTAVAAISFGSLSASAANLLTDPGFESNPVTSDANVLGNFPVYQGQWGQENSSIVGVDGAISPFQGAKQLKMDPTNTGSYTQAFQTVDISSFAAAIDSNSATLTASAYYNSNAPAASASIFVSYFTGNSYGTLTTTDSATMTLDANTGTWQQLGMNKPIPALTRWVLFQVAYNNSFLPMVAGSAGTLEQSYGYVDAASFEIRTSAVPTPAAWTGGLVLLGVAGVSGLRRTKGSPVA